MNPFGGAPPPPFYGAPPFYPPPTGYPIVPGMPYHPVTLPFVPTIPPPMIPGIVVPVPPVPGTEDNNNPSTTTDSSSSSSSSHPSGWAEHISEGRTFYFNSKTGESSWVKPDALKTPEELADTSSLWKEFKNAQGQIYYHNAKTGATQWEKPDELKQKEGKDTDSTTTNGKQQSTTTSTDGDTTTTTTTTEEKSSLQSSTSDASNTDTQTTSSTSTNTSASTSTSTTTVSNTAKPKPPTPTTVTVPSAITAPTTSPSLSPSPSSKASATKRPVTVTTAPKLEVKVIEDEVTKHKSADVTYATKQDAIDAFQSLLTDKKITSTHTWNTALPLIVGDKRYQALKTVSQRKEIFDDYIKYIAIVEQQIKQKKMSEARQGYLDLLSEKDLAKNPRWRVLLLDIEKDPRFITYQQVLKEAGKNANNEMEDEFDDLVTQVTRTMSELKKQQRQERRDAFQDWLEKQESITTETQWRHVAQMPEVSSNPTFRDLSDDDKIELFDLHIRQLLMREREQHLLQREQQKQHEKSQREQYRSMLIEMASKGIFYCHSRLKECKEELEKDPRYQVLVKDQPGEEKRLFEEYCAELESQIDTEKHLLKSILKDHKHTISLNDTETSILELIKNDTRFTEMNPVNTHLAITESLVKFRLKYAQIQKKLPEYRERLLSWFHELVQIGHILSTTTYDELKHTLEHEGHKFDAAELSVYDKLSDEDRKNAFTQVMKLFEKDAKPKSDTSTVVESKDVEMETDKDKKHKKDGKKDKKHKKDKHKKHKKRKHSSSDSDDDDKGSPSASRSRSRSRSRDKKRSRHHHSSSRSRSRSRDRRR